MQKLSKLYLPAFVINWICSFLSGRSQQCCKINGCLYSPACIGLCLVQGSGIGPMLYTIMKHDVHNLSKLNAIFKYADDTTLLAPEHTDIDISEEFQHI